MGHLEEAIQRQSRAPQRAVLEEAAQQKADQAPPVCPVCGRCLSRCHDSLRMSPFGLAKNVPLGRRLR